MFGLLLGLYMVTGWVGAVEVVKIAKKERKKARFMGWVNTTIQRLRVQGGYVLYYEDLYQLIPAHSLFDTVEVIHFLRENEIIRLTETRIELTEKFK